jgi:putative aminopeptidase FrvX
VACGLDRASYAASQITDDGYLRLHRIGRGSTWPLWDQAHEAQQVRILTSSGPVAGVVARSNGHFGAQHANETAVVTTDDLWVDVGARSAAEVNALGIQLLDPVTRHLPPWIFADAVAGPGIGGRAGCSAVATLAASAARAPNAGTTTFVLSAQHGLGWVGLGSLIARGGPVDEVVIVAPGEADATVASQPAESTGRLAPILERAGVDSVMWIAPRVRWPGAMMETITRDAAGAVLTAASEALGIEVSPRTWVAAPERQAFVVPAGPPRLDPIADVLTELVELYGAPGHEWAVRRRVLESLPAWARDRAEVDDIGNITVAVGPAGEATVFMAHTDEVAYEIETIASDGVVTLAARGGAVSSAWEGQTALLHFDPPGAPSTRSGTGADLSARWKSGSLGASAPPPLRGVFLSRGDPDEKSPGALRAWFGLERAELEARGVAIGSAVTSHKEGLRLGTTRFTARALDDRAGSSALLLAIRALDPERVPQRVVFAWSVHEEGGLRGAAALARRLGTTTRQAFSVDTFVSSDTPLESPHFAYAPLGSGAVLRSIENSSVAPEATRARVLAIAAAAGIPLQVGLTQGGTDGTMFTFWGAPNAGLSWPGRYSHSPGEVLDLQDLAALRDLIVALATSAEEAR